MFVANYLTQDLLFYENDSCRGEPWQHMAVMGVSEGQMIRLKVPRREPLREELLSFSEAVSQSRGANRDWRGSAARTRTGPAVDH